MIFAVPWCSLTCKQLDDEDQRVCVSALPQSWYFSGSRRAGLWPKGSSQERDGGGGNMSGSQEQMLETSHLLSSCLQSFHPLVLPSATGPWAVSILCC